MKIFNMGRKPLFVYIVTEDEILYDPFCVTQGYSPQYLYQRALIAWENQSPEVLRRPELQGFEVHCY